VNGTQWPAIKLSVVGDACWPGGWNAWILVRRLRGVPTDDDKTQREECNRGNELEYTQSVTR